MPSVPPFVLAAAIRYRYGCDPVLSGSKWVAETLADERPWIGRVYLFDLIEHPTATRCYAWGYSLDAENRFECITVLDEGAVPSAEAAVRAYLASRRSRPSNGRPASEPA